MQAPTTRADLEALIANKVQESLHLDYKDSRALSAKWPGELSKDVSAFANSDGGLIIYGVRELNHLPSAIDDGVSNSSFTKERIEQHLRSNIAPRLEGLVIHRVPLATESSAFVIEVPKSHRAPHHDRVSMKYYKRWNFESVPMEDYELADLRARSRTLAPLVSFDVEIRSSVLFLFVVSNPSDVTAYDVRFDFSQPLTWDEDPPGIIAKGIKVLPPRREYHVFYGVSHEVLNESTGRCAHFDVDISYYHPTINQRLSEVVNVNLRDYLGTWPADPPTKDLEDTIKKSLNEVRDQLKRVADNLSSITSIGGASGLQLSVNTLESLASSLGHEGRLAKRDPSGQSPGFFAESLGVDMRTALAVYRHFREHGFANVEMIEGVTHEVIDRMKRLFTGADAYFAKIR